ncbi:CinA family protein [Novosphingobium bradum]|uniref:CinA family protein n=1 Tax=Novosphingobium bradum TaxID=1737444 RepID=A0ABV7IVE8_9SPHN
MIEALHPVAARIAAALLARGDTVAVADGASGGLISAALLTVPGALGFYVGGGVVYSLRSREVLFGLERAAFRGMRSASADYALLQARAIRDNLGADWGLAETGAAGGSAHPLGVGSGISVAAVVGPGVELTCRTETGSDARIGNIEAFAVAALGLLERALAG